MSINVTSQTPALLIAANFFATISFGFGINAIVRPANGLSFFEFPTTKEEKAALAAKQESSVVNGMMAVYGVRDIFMGVATYAAAYFSPANDHRILGCMLIATSLVAFADGAICVAYKTGAQWNHWGYAPVVGGIGAVLFGVLDPK